MKTKEKDEKFYKLYNWYLMCHDNKFIAYSLTVKELGYQPSKKKH